MRLLDTFYNEYTCRNSGCDYTCTSQFDIERHLHTDCQYGMRRCKWSGCQFYDLKYNILNHELTCNFGIFECPLCHENVPCCNVNTHYNTHKTEFDKLQEIYNTYN